MTNQRNRKRACVMIVEHDLEFGITLADWLAAHGYQAVLVRSVESAIDECRELKPQGVFIGLGRSEPTTPITLRRLLRTIEQVCPGISVITMGDQANEKLIRISTGRGIRQVLVHSIGFTHIGRLLQAELNRAFASPASSSARSNHPDGCAIQTGSHTRAIHSEAAPWIG